MPAETKIKTTVPELVVEIRGGQKRVIEVTDKKSGKVTLRDIVEFSVEYGSGQQGTLGVWRPLKLSDEDQKAKRDEWEAWAANMASKRGAFCRVVPSSFGFKFGSMKISADREQITVL